MEQRTPEWHVLRSQHCCASEAPCVAGESIYPPHTWRELYHVKQRGREGKGTGFQNKAMAHGVNAEPFGRRWAERHFGMSLPPEICTAEQEGVPLLASLDGVSIDHKLVLELKTPFAGQESKMWKEVENTNEAPMHVLIQMTHQWAVTRAERVALVVYDVEEARGLVVIYEAEGLEKLWSSLFPKWKQFWSYYSNLVEPPIEDHLAVRADNLWQSAGNLYREATLDLDRAQEAQREAKLVLEALAEDYGEDVTSISGGAVKVTRVTRKGNVDYKAIPELAAVDLEPFRKAPSQYWRITVQETEE